MNNPSTGSKPGFDERVWNLYTDWCFATGRRHLPATPGRLSAFFEALPVAPSTERVRARALRRTLTAMGHPLEITTTAPPAVWRTGSAWLDLADALERSAVAGWPRGLRGRRDAWLLVLVGEMGLSRREAVQVTAAEVHTDGDAICVQDSIISRSDEPLRCPACAVTRWARIVATADWSRYLARDDLLAASVRPEAHDCRDRLHTSWRSGAWQMSPAIDQYGWFTNWRPMSLRAVSAVVAYRQAATAPPEPAVIEQARQEAADRRKAARPSGEWRGVATEDLLDHLDEQTSAVDEVLRRVEAAVEATHETVRNAQRPRPLSTEDG